MTDKQIIIDKSKCKHYWNGNCSDWDNKLIGACDDFEDCYCKMYLRKEQECEELKKQLKEMNEVIRTETTRCNLVNILKTELDQLKAEVKSKTEYIQEQIDIINQYSKEIEIYKKCQGKRASKREEELKAENDNIKETFDGLFKVQYKLADNNKKLRQCLTEIKEIANKIANYYDGDEYELMRKDAEQILQKISEVKDE